MAQKTNAKTAAHKPLTKLDAVRRALAELGRDAKPTQIQGFVKERFGVEMTTDHISTSKGDILRKARKQTKSSAPRPVVQPSAARKPAGGNKNATGPKSTVAPVAVSNRMSGGIPLDDILKVKDLVVRLGEEQLRVLINAFAK